MTKTYYFNTGVRYHPGLAKLVPGQIWRDGVKLIPFDCDDVPEGATFAFACDATDLYPGQYIVREIKNSSMLSKHAYFTKPIKPIDHTGTEPHDHNPSQARHD